MGKYLNTLSKSSADIPKMEDYILRRGTSGGWEYIKYNSGYCEFFYCDVITDGKITKKISSSNIFYSYQFTISQVYPFTASVEIYMIEALIMPYKTVVNVDIPVYGVASVNSLNRVQVAFFAPYEGTLITSYCVHAYARPKTT